MDATENGRLLVSRLMPWRTSVDDAHRRARDASLMRLYYRQLPLVLAVHFAVPPMLMVVVWGSVPKDWLIGWAAVVIAFGVIRITEWVVLRRGKRLEESAVLDRRSRALFFATVSGCLWAAGIAYILLTSTSLAHQVFTAFVVGMMGAGAVSGMSYFMPAFYGAMLPVVTAATAALFALGGQPYLTMAGMMFLFLFAIVYFANTVHRAYARSVTLRVENTSLVESLAAARDAADAVVVKRTQELQRANKELEERITAVAAAERAREQSERQLRLIIDNVPVLISFVGRDLRFRMVNKKYQEWFGKNLIGRPVVELIGPKRFRERASIYERVFAGETVTFEEDLNRGDEVRHTRITFVPHHVADARVDAFIALAVDRTEEHRRELALRESEDRLRNVIQNMPVMMAATDRDGKIIVWNRECERVTGYGAEEIVGTEDGLALLYPDEEYRRKVRDAMVVHSDYRDWELELTHRDGGVKTISWFNISSRFPVPGWQSWEMGFDVSDRKRARADLEHALRQLEQALEQEKELGELKSRFVAMASHEFRTPLTTIRAAADMLLRYGDRLAEEQKTENLIEIQREVGHIDDLLMGVLTIGEVAEQPFSFAPEPTDLDALCSGLIDKARLEANERHSFVHDRKGDCDSVWVDPQLVRHVLTNLLSNAVKYSPDGGTITVTTRCGGDDVFFSVADQGIGIPVEGRDRIFEAFHRFDNVRTISGTGLGLAILKQAVDSHGGTVEFESEVGRGTAFRVTLPQRRASAEIGPGASGA